MECDFYIDCIDDYGGVGEYTYDLNFTFRMFGCELNFNFRNVSEFHNKWKNLLEVPTLIKSSGKGYESFSVKSNKDTVIFKLDTEDNNMVFVCPVANLQEAYKKLLEELKELK